MKAFAHVTGLAFALGLAGLLGGCVSNGAYRTAQRIEPANDFEVVETSARRPLSGKEMAELRGTVLRYLDQQGETDTGDYYLKVYLTPEVEGVTPEWVVVRFTRYSDTRVGLVAGAPGYDYPYASSFYSYDVYPYGDDGFGRIAFQYYDDPIFGRRYYYPRRDHRPDDHNRDHAHNRDSDHNRDHRPDNVTNHNPPPANPPGRPDYRHRHPDRSTPPLPPRTETAGQSPRPAADVSRGQPAVPPDRTARPADRTHPWRGRSEANAASPRLTNPPSNVSAPPTSAPRAAPARPEVRATAPAPERRPAPSSSGSDRREVRSDGHRRDEAP